MPERIEFLRSPALPGMEVLKGAGCSHAWRVFHERYAITACESVSALVRYRDRTWRLEDGSVVFFEPGEVHCNTEVPRPQDFKVLFVDPALAQQAAQELGAPAPHFRAIDAQNPELFNAIRRLAAALESGESVLAQQSWFALCMGMILEHGEKAPRALRDGSPAVQRAKACLLERYSDPVSLDELSAVSGLSRFHLVRAFSRIVGMSPHAYQVHVRIERASALLRSGTPLVEVAAQVGFTDQSHLARHFRRVWGITPSGYASACRGR